MTRMERFEIRKFKIEQAFTECFYVVPDYQREYIWTEKQIEQLLEDIHEQCYNSTSEYFIGTVLVSPAEDESDHCDVIDGQQRLTTIFLILCALRARFEGMRQGEIIDRLTSSIYTDSQGDVKRDLRLEPWYENAVDVIEKIVQAKSDPQTVTAAVQRAHIPIYGSVENILNAYDVIYRFLLDNYADQAKLTKYWAGLARRVVFIQISDNISSALKIFETINERGVGLNPMDLLKNLLFTHVSQTDFSKLKDAWKKITGPLEKNNEKPLRFLRYFLMANYEIKNDRSDGIVREDEIYDWCSDKENAELTDHQTDALGFVDKITRNVGYYINFTNRRGTDGEPNIAMESLERLTGRGFRLHYVLLLAAAKLPVSLFDQFVARLESFLFYYIFTKTPTRDLERNFTAWADEVRGIADLAKREEQGERLNVFIRERFAKNMDKMRPELEDALKRLTFNSMARYRTKYLLARLTQHVDMEYDTQKTRDSLDPYFKLEIEHILPTNPKEGLRNTWNAQHHEFPYDEMNVRLGNLTLLEKSINIVAGNDFYSRKVQKYANSRNYLTKSLSGLADVGKNTSITRINKYLSAFEKWDAEDIEKRQLLLVNLALEVWKITEIKA